MDGQRGVLERVRETEGQRLTRDRYLADFADDDEQSRMRHRPDKLECRQYFKEPHRAPVLRSQRSPHSTEVGRRPVRKNSPAAVNAVSLGMSIQPRYSLNPVP